MRSNRLGGIIGKGSLQCSAMQLVLLGGELGEKYGTQHEYYNLRTPADAIKLLCVNYPEFQRDLVTAHERGVGYKVIKGLPMEGYDEINLPFGSKPLMLVPVITGSGSSTGQILLGVGLVAFSILAAPLGAGFLGLGAGFGATAAPLAAAGGGLIAGTGGIIGAVASSAIGFIGTSLILSGTASLISPQPEIPNLGNNRLQQGTRAQGTGPQGITRGASGEQSYLFTGPANTVGAGAVVPVIYGRVITGSHLIASTLEVVDDSDPHLKTIGKSTKESVRINGEKVGRDWTDAGGLLTRRVDDNFELGGSRNGVRELVNHEFGPGIQELVDDDDTSSLKKEAGTDYKKDKARKLDVFFSLGDGLMSYASADDTTQFDGTISYRIEVVVQKSGENLLATANATIQGFFNNRKGVDPYVYAHRLEVPKFPDAENEELKVKVIVQNAECREETLFKFVGFGYNIL